MNNMYVSAAVAPSAIPQIIRRPFLVNGYFEEIAFRFYPGQMLDLELTARVQQAGGSMVEIVAGGDMGALIAGDDDTLKFSAGLFVRRGEVLEIMARNKTVIPDGESPEDYTYNFQVILSMQEVAENGR
ncbi:MAG: hypothetical protein VB085_08935 [Peptococcaceae bacterium]|nr:hypothetical protein [Peptococcaceae bacterium]